MSWCYDCNKETNDYYMVHDHIWYSVARQNEMLCIPCLEKRLKRQLRAYDFTGAPINYGCFGYTPTHQHRVNLL